MGISLHRGSVREPVGGLSAGIFDRKEKYIWVPFLNPTSVKEQGSPELILDYGAQRACL
jgi:hypothetical protein